jgi:hypothetical protein
MTKLVVEIFDDGALSGTRPATQSEIDAAASTEPGLRAQLQGARDAVKSVWAELMEARDQLAASPQMREDAEVGRAIANLPSGSTFERTTSGWDIYVVDENIGNEEGDYFEGETLRAALIASGLLGTTKCST